MINLKKYPKPHWKWPPNSKGKIKAINQYYFNQEKKNKNGYPKIVEIFEKNFAKYHKTKYALTFNSGTSSLQAALYAVGVKKNDEVIVPSMTHFATATPVFALNAIPILADCELDTGNISPKDIEKKITKKTKAIMVTHLCGHPCEMDSICKIAKNHKIALIEDCSHAHGSTYKRKKVGTFGDIGCFSLDNNKILAGGEGGILITNKKVLFEKSLLTSDIAARLLSEITYEDLSYFKETGLGYKHRIHPVSAAIANYELKNLKKYILKRKNTLNYFSKKLDRIEGIKPPVTRKNCDRGAFFGYRAFISDKVLKKIKINNLIQIFNKEGLEVRLAGNRPLHRLPLFSNKNYGPKFLSKDYKKYKNFSINQFKNSERFYSTTISFPTFTFESKNLIDTYVKVIEMIIKRYY